MRRAAARRKYPISGQTVVEAGFAGRAGGAAPAAAPAPCARPSTAFLPLGFGWPVSRQCWSRWHACLKVQPHSPHRNGRSEPLSSLPRVRWALSRQCWSRDTSWGKAEGGQHVPQSHHREVESSVPEGMGWPVARQCW